MEAQTSSQGQNVPRTEIGSIQNLTKGLQNVSLNENQSEPGEEVPDELYIQYGMRFIRDGEYRIRGSPTPAYGLVAYLVPMRLLPTRKKLGDFFEMVFIKTGRANLQKLHCIECRSVFSSPTELGTHLRDDEKTHRKGPRYLQSLRGEIVDEAVEQEVIEYSRDKEASFKEIDKRFRENFDSMDAVVYTMMVDYYAACMVMRTIEEMTEDGAKRKKENVKRKEENRIRQICEPKTKTKKKNAKKKKKKVGAMATNEANNNMSRAYDDNDGTTPKDSAADSQEESKQGHAQRKPGRNKSKKKKGNAAASNAQQLEHG